MSSKAPQFHCPLHPSQGLLPSGRPGSMLALHYSMSHPTRQRFILDNSFTGGSFRPRGHSVVTCNRSHRLLLHDKIPFYLRLPSFILTTAATLSPSFPRFVGHLLTALHLIILPIPFIYFQRHPQGHQNQYDSIPPPRCASNSSAVVATAQHMTAVATLVD